MNGAQIAVTLGGIFLIGFTLWFFFGKAKRRPAQEPAGRFACPMHPWITSDRPDAECSVCGMKLVQR